VVRLNLLKFIELQKKHTILHRIPIPLKSIPPIIVIVAWYLLGEQQLFMVYGLIIVFCIVSMSFILRAPRYVLDIFIAFMILYIFGGVVYWLVGLGFWKYLADKMMWFLYLLALAYSLALLLSSTSVAQLEEFLKRIHLPEKIVMALVVTYNLIPAIYGEVLTIIQSQKARGLEFSKNPLKRLRQLVAVYIPTIFVALTRASILEMALKARGYG